MGDLDEELLPRTTYEGRGDNWQDAFDDAATQAIDDGVPPGTELDVLGWKVATKRARRFIVVIG